MRLPFPSFDYLARAWAKPEDIFASPFPEIGFDNPVPITYFDAIRGVER
jgi:hypothetical protein